jgi:ribose-phosphate pyrophosphokinase
MNPTICIGVHGVFAAGAYDALREQNSTIVTTNTITHPSNAIDVTPLLVDAVRNLV